MTARVVDARFAGGAICVEVGALAHAPDSRVVSVTMPGNTAAMWPDEARRFAVALIEQAANAEAPDEGDWP